MTQHAERKHWTHDGCQPVKIQFSRYTRACQAQPLRLRILDVLAQQNVPDNLRPNEVLFVIAYRKAKWIEIAAYQLASGDNPPV